MRKFTDLVFLLALGLCTGQTFAQAPAITVLRDLSFGTNITGTKTIAYNNSAASQISVVFPTYSQQGNVTFTFMLPTSLTDVAGNSLPISFASNSAAYHVDVNSTSGATVFNPNNGLSGTLGQAAHTDYFWLGGTVTPGSNYTASTYTGTITVVVTATIGAQVYTSNETIAVSATLIGNVSLAVTGSLDFGLVVAGTTPPSLSAQSGSAAMITASGTGGSPITVTYAATTSLNDMYGHTLTFTPSVYGANSSSSQATATSVASGSRVTLSGRRRQTGHYYFWLGGALSPVPTGQSPGSYVGNFWLTVSY
jgi:Domain of unknown function (DUF4402)